MKITNPSQPASSAFWAFSSNRRLHARRRRSLHAGRRAAGSAFAGSQPSADRSRVAALEWAARRRSAGRRIGAAVSKDRHAAAELRVGLRRPLDLTRSAGTAPKSSSAARRNWLSCENSAWWALPSGADSIPVSSGSSPSKVGVGDQRGVGRVGDVDLHVAGVPVDRHQDRPPTDVLDHHVVVEDASSSRRVLAVEDLRELWSRSKSPT